MRKEISSKIAAVINEIGSSRRYNLHSHTEFCDGRAQMEAFAREVVARGFTHYGFTPHSPVPVVSPCNMTRHNVEAYFREYDRINATYGDRCRFYRSMEIDYFGRDWSPTHDYFQAMDLDYTIGSVHFLPSQDGIPVDIAGRYEAFERDMERYFHRDIRYVVEIFYERSLMMVEQGGFDIIGHLDKIGHNASYYAPGIEQEGWHRALRDELARNVVDAGIVVEINTKAWKDHRRIFPDPEMWQMLADRGATFVVNSDAHVPALIDSGRDEAFAILDSLTHNHSSNHSSNH